MPRHINVTTMNFMAMFDLALTSFHEAAWSVTKDTATDADRANYMKDLLEIKRIMDKYIKREVTK